ncbi:MAG: hypothetical protein WDM92_16450 [Caulobacteraceae bacterium]
MAKFGAVLGSASNLRYNAGWAGKVLGETIEGNNPGRHTYTLKQPIGGRRRDHAPGTSRCRWRSPRSPRPWPPAAPWC